MKIVNLQDLPSCIETVARWHYREWGALYPGSALSDFRKDMEASLLTDLIPQTWVLAEGGRVWGSVSILKEDLPNYPEFSPWLANVYVEPSKRGHGYGQQLVKEAMGYARQQNLGPLFLYTPDQVNFYEQLGWRTFHEDIYHGKTIFLMSNRPARV
ncbi:GNAT family N-acetyltransferase [Endozoicomonas sp. GU-1]|uniref:GNAT family N-acetyltransferase n=1 Tax=Endozoicomonas sp. GU-1 TaxID=3009078 RepID=UPI0022B32B0A|nr:GNAT family N-acetyltransferase [Endozoicomonas sp. GU-1]WBA82763.1 GNAT family N-acetyltransferase [Endozoicomonas sp. GU-1]WBA85693.1 GNAT family N-acetyltransferase [Endozoicomonas sp. GU-1]